MLLSEVTTCKEIRMNPDAFSNAQKPWLPCFPGTTLIRSLNQNVQIAMTWNWFDMRFSNKMYWLYERRDRLIFKTILMIRKVKRGENGKHLTIFKVSLHGTVLDRHECDPPHI